MKAQVYVANALPEALALIGQELGLSGTTHAALGFGAWGVEPTTVVEFGDVLPVDLQLFLRVIFADYPEEEALYVVQDSKGQTVYRLIPTNEPAITFYSKEE